MSVGSPAANETTNNQTQPNSIEQIQANNIIVINPGSLYLRIGLASHQQPHSIYHVIARKNKSNHFPVHVNSFLVPTANVDKEILKNLSNAQVIVERTLNSCLSSDGRLRKVTSKDVLIEYNKKVKPVVIKNDSVQWTNTNNRDTIVGEEVISLNPNEPYHIRWPIRRGKLNIHNGVGGSITSVIADLESIWSFAIEKYLNISVNDLKNYKAVLTIPDVYNRNHVKHLIDLLINGLKFESCIVLLESLCSTFGAGLSYACVVDCGDQKTSICCVEDGFSSRYTRLTMDFGGNDITQLFYYLIKQRNFPFASCKPQSRICGVLLQELKENCCHVNLDICDVQQKQFTVQIPEQPALSYTFFVGDECMLAPLALFYPELFALTNVNNRIHILHRNEGDPDDPFDENYLIQTKRKYGETIEAGGQTGDTGNVDQAELDELDQADVSTNEKEISTEMLLGIDQAILQCIDRCDSDEIKRKMYSCILITGGGMSFVGIDKWLHSRLSMQIPLQYRGQQIDIIVKPKDTDPRILTWKGATLVCLLDTAQEMWINKSEWEKSSIRILREKASFVY